MVSNMGVLLFTEWVELKFIAVAAQISSATAIGLADNADEYQDQNYD